MHLRTLAAVTLFAGFLVSVNPPLFAADPTPPIVDPKTAPVPAPPSGGARGSFRAVLRPKIEINLPSSAAGIIKAIHLVEGSPVKKDQPLISLDSDMEKAEVAQAEASLRGAKADLERANAEFERVRTLYTENISANKFYVDAKAQADLALARSDGAAALVDQAKAKLANRTICSPIDGIFLKMHKSVGEAVDRYETVARIVDVMSLEMTIFCDATYFTRFRTGQRVEMRVFKSAQDQPIISGIIVHTDPIIDPAYLTFRIKIKIDPSPNAIPGLQAFLISPVN